MKILNDIILNINKLKVFNSSVSIESEKHYQGILRNFKGFSKDYF